MMQAHGILFMAKAKPLATTAVDSTFVLTLLAYDRIAKCVTTPWHIHYAGPQAKTFWEANRAQLCVPGQPLQVQCERVQAHSVGQYLAPEVHAIATNMRLAPWAHEAKQGLAPANAA